MRALIAFSFLVAFGGVGVLAINGMKAQSKTSRTPAPIQAIEEANNAASTLQRQAYQQQWANQQPK